MRRRFRPALAGLWLYPIAVALGAAVLVWLVRHPWSSPEWGDRQEPDRLNAWWWAVLGGVATWTLWTLRSSWVEWSAWIDVDAEGLRWHEGGETYRILWDAVARLEVEGGEHPVVALALKQGGRAPLPFTTPALYRVLKDRFGPLPPVEENRMGLR